MSWNDLKNPEETAKKISKTLKAKGVMPPSNKGKKFTKEHVEKIIEAKRQNGSLYHTPERTKKIQAGRKAYYDNVGRTSSMRDLLEGTKQYKDWHFAVLVRDKFRCVQCGAKKPLHVDHIIPLDAFIAGAQGSFETLLEMMGLFDIGNGRVLCQNCHKHTATYGKKIVDNVRITGAVMLELENVYTRKIQRIYYKNMFVTAGKVALARSFFDDNYGKITYAALGTSAVAPALGDTQLGTELFRKAISVRSSSSNIFTAQTFFTTSEGNGTLREAGLFGDLATGVANSGTLFAHVAISRTKSSSDTLTLSWTITVG